MAKRSGFSLSLPEWFDLKKYEAASSLPLVDWALNLIARKELLHVTSGNYWKPKEEAIKYHESELELIKTYGVLSRVLLNGEYELAKYEYRIEEQKPGLGLVYPLPLRRAVEIHEMIQWDTELRHKLELIKYQEIFYSRRTSPLHSGEIALRDWYEDYYDKTSYDEGYGDFATFSPHICVDLGAPDETVVEAFKSWLRSVRKIEGMDGSELPEKLSDKLINRWVDSAILPYLDLKIYAQLEGIDIPLHVLGNAIFSDAVEIDTTEAVRKTTRQHAEKALKQAHGILRHALIMEEMGKTLR